MTKDRVLFTSKILTVTQGEETLSATITSLWRCAPILLALVAGLAALTHPTLTAWLLIAALLMGCFEARITISNARGEEL